MKPFYLLAALLVVAACKSDPKTVEINPVTQLQAEVDSLVGTVVQEDEPGAAVLISYDGEKLVNKGYGLRNLETGEPITPTTNMRMASVSKQFTALAVLALIEEGKLSLQDTIYKIYPFEGFQDVTVEHLLHHTSGLADAEDAFFTEWDSTRVAENKDLVDYYSKNPPAEFKPGTQWKYNNGTYELLAAIVEEVSGEPFAEYTRKQVFEKAGMRNTQFFNLAQPTEIPERAIAYEKDSTGQWKKVDGHFLNGLLGAGGIYTNLEDFYEYLQKLRQEAILSSESHELIFKVDSIPLPEESIDLDFFGQQPVYYAKGWEVSENIAVHSGGWFGTNTIAIHHLDQPLDIVIFMNSNRLFDSKLIDRIHEAAMEYVELSSGDME